MIGFSFLDPSGVSTEAKAPRSPEVQVKPKVVGAAVSTFSTADDHIRLAARTAVRANTGKDDFVKRIKRSHARERNWLPNLRTAQALLSIIDGLKANGVAVS